jgi:hypothetical protein
MVWGRTGSGLRVPTPEYLLHKVANLLCIKSIINYYIKVRTMEWERTGSGLRYANVK